LLPFFNLFNPLTNKDKISSSLKFPALILNSISLSCFSFPSSIIENTLFKSFLYFSIFISFISSISFNLSKIFFPVFEDSFCL
jgi:hypothetical protein